METLGQHTIIRAFFALAAVLLLGHFVDMTWLDVSTELPNEAFAMGKPNAGFAAHYFLLLFTGLGAYALSGLLLSGLRDDLLPALTLVSAMGLGNLAVYLTGTVPAANALNIMACLSGFVAWARVRDRMASPDMAAMAAVALFSLNYLLDVPSAYGFLPLIAVECLLWLWVAGRVGDTPRARSLAAGLSVLPLVRLVCIEAGLFGVAGQGLACLAVLALAVLAPQLLGRCSPRHLYAVTAMASGACVGYASTRQLYGDYFHYGETVTAVQQWLQYGKLPYVDVLGRGLFDYVPNLFYSLLHPGRPWHDSLLWGWGYLNGPFGYALTAWAVWCLLQRFFGGFAAWLLVVAGSVYKIVSPYYVPVLLFGLCVTRMKSGAGWLSVYGLALFHVFLFLWRVDFGSAVLATLLGFFVIQRDFRLLARYLLALAILLLALAGLYALLVHARGYPVLERMQMLITFYQVAGRAALYETYKSSEAVVNAWQFVMIPLAALLAFSLVRDVKLRPIILFLLVASIFFGLRSLARHSPHEGVINPYFFVLVTGLSCAVLVAEKLRAAVFALMIALSVIAVPRPSSLIWHAMMVVPDSAMYPSFWAGNRNLQAPAQPGILLRKPNAWPIQQYLQDNLRPSATFLDLTNNLMLYAELGRIQPLPTIEQPLMVTEGFQEVLLSLLEGQDIQYVITTDDETLRLSGVVSDELYSSRMYEYAYVHYRPVQRVGPYIVWATSGDPLPLVQTLNYRKVPLLYPLPAGQFRSVGLLPQEGNAGDYRIGLDSEYRPDAVLDLQMACREGRHAQLRFDDSAIGFATQPGPARYRVRIGPLYRWFDKKAVSLQAPGCELASVALLERIAPSH